MNHLLISLFLVLFTGSFAQAQNISVTIDGQTYLCAGSGGSTGSYCDGKIDGLNTLVAACMESYSGAYCMDRYWGDFVKDNPGCKTEAIPVCLDACKKTYSGAYCADHCNNV